MTKILTFDEFSLNEEEGKLLKSLGQALTKGSSAEEVRSSVPDFLRKMLGDDMKKPEEEASGDEATTAVPADSRIRLRDDIRVAPGNDDFALYLQHQQGAAGASGLIKALNGTGQMNPDTIKTKNGVKYANLVQNIHAGNEDVKKGIISALDAGDQKSAAFLFLNMWKRKWAENQKLGKSLINKPEKSEVKDAIKKACDKYGVPFDFAVTVATIESGLNPKASGPTYKGLFQMNPSSSYGGTLTPLGNNWSDPYANAENGVKYLRDNIASFKKQLGKDIASLDISPWAKNLA